MLPLYVSEAGCSWNVIQSQINKEWLHWIHMHQLQINTQNTRAPLLCYWSYVHAALSFTQAETEQLF